MRQDAEAPGWLRLLQLVDQAATDGREVFSPLIGLTREQRQQVITLPATVSRLTKVKHLVLYGSYLVRLPAEIGDMTSLEEFSPYTSYQLHWFPHELTRCARLRESTVSTRALYGNYKTRPPFPSLTQPRDVEQADPGDLDPAVWGATSIRSCSVCAQPVALRNVRQRWISLPVALPSTLQDYLDRSWSPSSEPWLAFQQSRATPLPPSTPPGGPIPLQALLNLVDRLLLDASKCTRRASCACCFTLANST